MSVYKLIWKRDEPYRLRLQAFTNLFCVCYLVSVTLLVTHMGFFHILPACYFDQGWTIFLHRVAISYLFISAVSQFLTCVFTDSRIQESHKLPFSREQLKKVKREHGKKVEREFLHFSSAETRIVRSSTGPPDSMTDMHFCKPCNLIVSKRTHHCILCKNCVTKRDHHCFFMGVCIGESNHLHFIYFTLYMGIGTFYGLLLLAKYLALYYGVRFHGPHTFVFVFGNTMLGLLNGVIPTATYLIMFFLLYISLFGTMTAFGFFFWHLFIVARGQTTYEARAGIKKFSKDSIAKNWRVVFRSGSFLTLIVPFWDLVTDNNKTKDS